jgi:hypothetical protein
MFEKFHLPEALYRFGARPVRTTQIFARLLREDMISVFSFHDHSNSLAKSLRSGHRVIEFR